MSNSIYNFIEEADQTMLRVSDGSSIRILKIDSVTPNDRLTLLLIPGWGSVDETWNSIVEEVVKYFNLVFVETREKYSSVLNLETTHDLDRLSKDIQEVIQYFSINEKKLIMYGSSWAALIVADGLSKRRFTPFLPVLLGPIIAVPMPIFTRHLITHLPSIVLEMCSPFVTFWLSNFKSDNEEQTNRYLLVVEKANTSKWKTVGKHFATKNFLDVYSQINSQTLVIVASNDKMHPIDESTMISNVIPKCTVIDMHSVRDFDSHLVIEVIRKHLAIMN